MCLSVDDERVLCKNDYGNRAAVCGGESGEHRERYVRRGSRSPWGRGKFMREMGLRISVQYSGDAAICNIIAGNVNVIQEKDL